MVDDSNNVVADELLFTSDNDFFKGMSKKQYIKDKAHLSALQDKYYQRLIDNGFDLERGIKNSDNEHISIKEFKKITKKLDNRLEKQNYLMTRDFEELEEKLKTSKPTITGKEVKIDKDTYDTLKSGILNAIRVFTEMRNAGIPLTYYGIRMDSGDLAYLSKQVRKMLDEAGFPDAVISASNDLDEYLIESLKLQGAAINSWGVGTNLITSKDCPSFGGVYKLAAVEDGEGHIIPKIKISENVGKITNPHFKKLYRFYGNDTGKAIADYLCLHDETVDDSKDLEIFDPEATWKTKTVYNFTAKELQVPIFRQGQLVYRKPTLEEIRAYCQQQVDTLWDEVKRFDNPHTYYVDLSRKLWTIKNDMLRQKR